MIFTNYFLDLNNYFVIDVVLSVQLYSFKKQYRVITNRGLIHSTEKRYHRDQEVNLSSIGLF